MPISTARVRSAITVRVNVISQTEIVGEIERDDGLDLAPFAHVVGHHEQDRGQRRQRDKLRQRCKRPG